MAEILNKIDVDDWVYAHAHVMGHVVRGIKGKVRGMEGLVNIAFEDVTTRELINIERGEVDEEATD